MCHGSLVEYRRLAPWPAFLPLLRASVLASSPLLFRPQHLKWEGWWAMPSTAINTHQGEPGFPKTAGLKTKRQVPVRVASPDTYP